ncbi:hypothetical protein SELMODRAFT_407388 [Selaginella moellendorffii]|uniref:Uncharacterized protein n=1 Tax=Selaginella moellendorffii TaxID=88036 RepID=D8R5F9_SELML|nr:hypothetical protein SELMODRAFT_407388 [Selaginella moellendorffii]
MDALEMLYHWMLQKISEMYAVVWVRYKWIDESKSTQKATGVLHDGKREILQAGFLQSLCRVSLLRKAYQVELRKLQNKLFLCPRYTAISCDYQFTCTAIPKGLVHTGKKRRLDVHYLQTLYWIAPNEKSGKLTEPSQGRYMASLLSTASRRSFSQRNMKQQSPARTRISALQLLTDGVSRMPMGSASRKWGIPATSLSDWVYGCTKTKTRGIPIVFTPAEEELVVEWIGEKIVAAKVAWDAFSWLVERISS